MLRDTSGSTKQEEATKTAMTEQGQQEVKVKEDKLLDLNQEELFKKIEIGDHAEVERILAERDNKVQIIPRIGCSQIHYTKLNLANKEDENEDSPLIMAAKVDYKMVEIILKYGGNPNHANEDGDTPLSIAANRYDKDTISSLLLAGGDLEAAVVKLTSTLRHVSEKQLRENSDMGFSVRPLTILLADDVYLKCRDPIKTAFSVCKKINRIKNVRDEFEVEFELLMQEADNFAYSFLDHCDKMAEVKEILSYPVNLLKKAIDQEKKQFVSHPFSQQLINERWNGDLTNTLFRGKTMIALKYATSPIMLPLLFLKFLLTEFPRGIPLMKSSFAELLRLTFTPYLCFLTDALNYLIFLAILICACVIPSDGDYHVGTLDYVLYFCVFSRILIEIDFLVQQGWKEYFQDFWNIVDNIIIILICVAAVYKGMVQYRFDGLFAEYTQKLEKGEYLNYTNVEENLMKAHHNSMNVKYMYAATEFFVTLRVLDLLEISKSIGTMLIALKYLIIDVLKFGTILLTVIIGTSIAIYSMTISIREWNTELTKSVAKLFDGAENYTFSLLPYNQTHPEGKVGVPVVFETFFDTMRNIMWSTFGLLDVVNLAVEHEKSTTDFIDVILIFYVLLSCVLLLNMLIGILGSTFDRIKENCDIEWRYARSQLLKEYSKAQPLFFPFFTLCFPFIIWFRRRLREEHSRKKKKDTGLTEEAERDKLISAVCDRYIFGNLVGDSGGKFVDPEEKTGTFEQRMKSRKQKSVRLQSAAEVKK